MSPTGRPEGEYRSAQREGVPVCPTGRPEGEYRSAQRAGAPVTDALWQLAAVDIAARVGRGELTAVAVVESALARLLAANPAVNAVTVVLAEQALARARALDAALAGGATPGPLQGVPVTIKENVDQRGLPTPNGVPALANAVAPDDAPVVANLLAAGAVVIGRTNTPEFSFRWFTENPLRGRTANPWQAERTAGGSSGGAAASVALGIGAIAHGNDLGGSLRYPAYACGVATIRPSLGRVPAFSPSAVEERPPQIQLMSVQGPICREVRDVRLALSVMARGDPRDPWWVPAPLEGPPVPPPIRVALTRGPCPRRCHPTVVAQLQRAGELLADAGYVVEEVDPPALQEIAERFLTLVATDTRVMMEPTLRRLGSPELHKVYDTFTGMVPRVDLDRYVRAVADRTRLWRLWSVFMEHHPLVLMPVSHVPPLRHGEDLAGSERFRALREEQAPQFVVNLLGLPAAAVPTGFADGLPTGVQIVARRFREDMALDAAQAIETRTGVLAHELWARGAG